MLLITKGCSEKYERGDYLFYYTPEGKLCRDGLYTDRLYGDQGLFKLECYKAKITPLRFITELKPYKGTPIEWDSIKDAKMDVSRLTDNDIQLIYRNSTLITEDV